MTRFPARHHGLLLALLATLCTPGLAQARPHDAIFPAATSAPQPTPVPAAQAPAEKAAQAPEKAAPAGEDYLAEEGDDYALEKATAADGTPDPIEGVNRPIHSFNKGFDTYLLRPVSKGYEYVVPKQGRKMVYNALENLESPVVFVNSVLQGDPQNSFVTFWRFVFNSTLGVAGLFDMATELGVPPRRNEDFGQTLGKWGVGQGGYLVLPILGPSSFRDAPAKVIDWFLNPFYYIFNGTESFAIAVVDGVDTRTRYGTLIDNLYTDSLDPYVTFRSLYLQRRVAEVNDQRSSEGAMVPTR